MPHIIDGKAIAAAVREEIALEATRLREERGLVPGLNLLLVGDDPASHVYVRNKARACEQVGIRSVIERLPATASQDEVLSIVRAWNVDPAVHGILVQLPLPKHIDERTVILTIDPHKDVDGFHPENAGRLMIGMPGFIPCTPAGIMHLIGTLNVNTTGMHAVVVGRSNIVGKPIANLLAQKRPNGNCTVTLCHTGTKDMGAFTRSADILVAAVGVPRVITAEHVKPGAIVIDVGINRIDGGDGTSKLVGDVDFDSVAPLASAITPVPGGVGPMTIAMLLRNTMLGATGEAFA